MSRPQRCRRVCSEPIYKTFSSENSNNGCCNLTVDEYEVIRLVDYNHYTHEDCAIIMNISRTTVTEMYEIARYKIADAMVNGKELFINGGNYVVCTNENSCPKCYKKIDIFQGGRIKMKIAVTYSEENVFQHFGHTSEFKIFDVEEGKIEKTEIVNTNGEGHGALSGFLKDRGVDVLICGGIGGGAQKALEEKGIKFFGGVSGNVDEVVKHFIAGSLVYDDNVHCDHHDGENHSCSGHSCGKKDI